MAEHTFLRYTYSINGYSLKRWYVGSSPIALINICCY